MPERHPTNGGKHKRRWQFTMPSLLLLIGLVATGLWLWQSWVMPARREWALERMRFQVFGSAKEAEIKASIAEIRRLGIGKLAATELAPSLKHLSAHTRNQAALALSQLGPDALPALNELVEALADQQIDTEPIVAALENLNGNSVDAVIAAWNKKLPPLGKESSLKLDRYLLTVQRLLMKPDSASRVLRVMREHADAKMRYQLLSVVQMVRNSKATADEKAFMTDDQTLANALVDLLSEDDNAHVRAEAAGALVSIAMSSNRVWPALVAALDDPVVRVRIEAAGALITMDKERGAAVSLPVVLSALDSPLAMDRALAAFRMASIDQGKFAEVWPVLQELLANGDPWVRQQALYSVAAFGTSAEPAIPVLIENLKRQTCDRYIRGPAIDALHRLGNATLDRRVEDLLIQIATDDGESDHCRYCAVKSLPDFAKTSRRSLDVLIRALRDTAPEVRFAAAAGLGEVGVAAAAAVPALQKAVNDEDSTVREFAMTALRKIASASGD